MKLWSVSRSVGWWLDCVPVRAHPPIYHALSPFLNTKRPSLRNSRRPTQTRCQLLSLRLFPFTFFPIFSFLLTFFSFFFFFFGLPFLLFFLISFFLSFFLSFFVCDGIKNSAQTIIQPPMVSASSLSLSSSLA